MTPKERYRIYHEYLLLKVFEKDWHGVCDAAMDIRELVAKHPSIEKDENVVCIHCDAVYPEAHSEVCPILKEVT